MKEFVMLPEFSEITTEKMKPLLAKFAPGEFVMSNSVFIPPSTMGLKPDPHELPDVKEWNFQCGHFFVCGHDSDAEMAADLFVANFDHICPWDAIKSRMTIGWRTQPQCRVEQDFEQGEPYYTVRARLLLLLDYPGDMPA